MENPNTKLKLISIRPKHAGEEVNYTDVKGCALHQALTEAGFQVFAVGSDVVTLDDNQDVKVIPGFEASDFRAVRAGRIVEYLYDEINKTMTRVE